MKVQLFLTCLSEQFYPQVLRDMTDILTRLGVEVSLPEKQICCGQPLFNSGFQGETTKVAEHWIKVFGQSPDMIVSPSGSCVDMVSEHYPHLFPEGSQQARLAKDLAGRTFEFTDFLVNVLQKTDLGASYPHRVTYHASCHYLRGLGLKTEAKTLLQNVAGLELVPMKEEDTCCGFGGVFSVVYPEVSRAMVANKVNNIIASGADTVVSCDAGCLMNIGGALHKANAPVRAAHIASILNAHEAVR
jgi:L-lactate dehydrogenase complex protein LldE